MGYFSDFWNMCSIMVSIKTKESHIPHIILLLNRMSVYKNPTVDKQFFFAKEPRKQFIDHDSVLVK